MPLTNLFSYDQQSCIKWKRDARVAISDIFGPASGHLEEFEKAIQEAPFDMFSGITSAQRGLTILQSMRDEVKYWPDDEEKPRAPSAKSPIELFDAMRFHPKVIESSRPLFGDGYYSDAIFRAFTAVCAFVKEKSGSPVDGKGSPLDGKSLMSTVFSETKPIIKLNDLLDSSDRNEQEGFKFLFMGGQIGIRNPKAHDNIVQTDPYRTLEYLSLASLLMKRVHEGKVVKL